MVDRKIHLNWGFSLERRASRGDTIAKRILEEAKTPGKYFDGPTHFVDVVSTSENLMRNPGVKAIGIFGSRLRCEHVPLKSDVDIFVIDDTPVTYNWTPSRGPTTSRDSFRRVGIAENINIQECSTAHWELAATDPSSVWLVAYKIMKSVRWLWVRQGYILRELPERVISR